MSNDPRLDALRYALEKQQREATGEDGGTTDVTAFGANPDANANANADASTSPATHTPSPAPTQAVVPTPGHISSFVEQSIQQAIRRGAFDNLPGAGKPLPRFVSSHDPDWWIRAKIANERISGLAPDAFTLRTEHTEFASRMDALATEAQVRAAVEDFNRRVIEARRQLLGGPPVVTPLHDADDEVRAWRRRRAGA